MVEKKVGCMISSHFEMERNKTIKTVIFSDRFSCAPAMRSYIDEHESTLVVNDFTRDILDLSRTGDVGYQQ